MPCPLVVYLRRYPNELIPKFCKQRKIMKYFLFFEIGNRERRSTQEQF